MGTPFRGKIGLRRIRQIDENRDFEKKIQKRLEKPPRKKGDFGPKTGVFAGI
jgi:hypothetical protein